MKLKWSLASLALMAASCCSINAQELVSYNLQGATGDQVSSAATFVDPCVTALPITRSANITAFGGLNSINSTNWAIGEYYSFGLEVNAGFQANLTTLEIGSRSSNTGPKFFKVYHSLDGFSAPLATIEHVGTTFSNTIVNLASLSVVTGIVEFRFTVDQDLQANGSGNPIASGGSARLTNYFIPTDPPPNVDSGGMRINGTCSPLVSAPQFVNARPYHSTFPVVPPVEGYDPSRVDTGVSLIQRGADPQQALLSNIISSQQGINGIVLDFDNLAALGDITLEYKMSPLNVFTQAVADWADVPPAPTATLLPDAGQAGSDRVLLTWPNFTIENRYLCIKVIYNGNTIAELYLGHLKGEMDGLGSSSAFIVRTQDIAAVRNELLQSKDASGRTDVDKNGIVRTQDIAQTRLNLTQGLTRVTIPATLPPES